MNVLLVNPPIYDFTAFDFWLRPYGLLRVAGRLRACKLTAFDYMVSRNRDAFGRGRFEKQLVTKPAPLADIPRRFYRFGRPREDLLRLLWAEKCAGGPPEGSLQRSECIANRATHMNVTKHTPGSFCTAVLHTRDLDRATDFYHTLVGWTTQPVFGTAAHRLVQFEGKTVASFHQTDGADIWLPHVSVEDLERTIADAIPLGASVIGKSNVEGLARLATLRDPEGALFGLWQPAPHQGAEFMEEIGSLWWVEVLSNNVTVLREFYRGLFSWDSVETSFEPFARYIVFKRGDVQEGGILPIGHDWGVSPRWNSIFAVADCDAILERAKALGGSTEFVHTVPKAGRIGILRDPGGAVIVFRGPTSAFISSSASQSS